MLSMLLCAHAFAGDHLETRWVRDSEEYWAITQQIYRSATKSVVAQKKKKDAWAVILDVDETVLDNSTYQLRSAAYGDSWSWETWNPWTERREASVVPGAVAFIEAVRKEGGKVVFLTNRHISTLDATRDNLVAVGAYQEGDPLCLLTDDEAYDKAARRAEVREGKGACSVKGKPMQIAAYIGDTRHDLPAVGEEGRQTFMSELGSRYFLLPNPMYGSWASKVTRPPKSSD